jgi:uncharacterized protein (UPF0147 family)
MGLMACGNGEYLDHLSRLIRIHTVRFEIHYVISDLDAITVDPDQPTHSCCLIWITDVPADLNLHWSHIC